MSRTEFTSATFSKDTPNKIGDRIKVSGKNTLIKTKDDTDWCVAIADEPIDAIVDGKKMFCVRVDNAGEYSSIMIGFTPMETFDSDKKAYFLGNGFTGCGIGLDYGDLCYPINKYHDIIDEEISKKAKEIITILTISNNGMKKEIRFLCDGNESQSSDVSKHLNGDCLFPAICLFDKNQRVTTIPIDQIKKRTPEIKNLIKEYQQQQQNNGIDEVKQARKKLLKGNEEMMYNFFKQFEQQTSASDAVEVETKKENKKEKKVKQVATKKTKKETKPKPTKATKKKEKKKNNKQKKSKLKK
jgi:hypothetical protein